VVVSKNAWFRRIAAVRSRPVLVRHAAPFGRWQGPDLSIAVLSDLHVAAPFTSLALIRRIGHAVTAMAPDMIVLAGDFLADGVMAGRHATARQIVDALDVLQAPLGVFAILGNHDWQDCPIARASRYQENSVAQAFHGHRIRLLRNQGVQLAHKGHDFNVVGFDSQRPVPKDWSVGLHRPEAAFADIAPEKPTILLAHEPDYFAQNDDRATVQISGHTHGGQLNLMGWRPVVPSQFGARYAHGHIRHKGRDLFVSGGLGFSGVPLRIGQPPEVTWIRLHSSKR